MQNTKPSPTFFYQNLELEPDKVQLMFQLELELVLDFELVYTNNKEQRYLRINTPHKKEQQTYDWLFSRRQNENKYTRQVNKIKERKGWRYLQE